MKEEMKKRRNPSAFREGVFLFLHISVPCRTYISAIFWGKQSAKFVKLQGGKDGGGHERELGLIRAVQARLKWSISW